MRSATNSLSWARDELDKCSVISHLRIWLSRNTFHCLVQNSFLFGRKKPIQVVNQDQAVLELHYPVNVFDVREDFFRCSDLFFGYFEDAADGIHQECDFLPRCSADYELVTKIDFPLRQTESPAQVINRNHIPANVDDAKHGRRRCRQRRDIHHAHGTFNRRKRQCKATFIERKNDQLHTLIHRNPTTLLRFAPKSAAASMKRSPFTAKRASETGRSLPMFCGLTPWSRNGANPDFVSAASFESIVCGSAGKGARFVCVTEKSDF